MQGLFLYNKPSGPSSAQFLNELKGKLSLSRTTRIGHGGTLDPFAEGLLVVGISRNYTKLLHEQLKNESKEYEVEIILGASSDTDDRTGNIQTTTNTFPITKKDIENAVKQLQKQKTQTPPQYSAIKLQGKPAYKRARAGEQMNIQPKQVQLHTYTIQNIREEQGLWVIQITMLVSAGFYIRSFARDLGKILGVGGYVNALKRLKIGDFSLKNALNLDDLDKTMTLYVLALNEAKNSHFLDWLEQAARKLKTPIKLENSKVVITGTLDNLQTILEHINTHTKKYDILTQSWFGK